MKITSNIYIKCVKAHIGEMLIVKLSIYLSIYLSVLKPTIDENKSQSNRFLNKLCMNMNQIY